MQKEIIGHTTAARKSHENTEWLDLESMARVELTSEDASFPIENVLSMNPERNQLGWRAASTGPQTIALVFTVPTHLRRIFAHFIDHEAERSQEFVLRYSSANGPGREIVRQQWNFSPTGSSQEIEDFTVDLAAVTKLELVIDPDRGGGQNRATLNALRLA
ncbi:carbohydrate-binding protein [Alloacidobacterium dinghuense]|uniref:Carbohydrate-binding protein n=1 Tax=Alloacidobacterium dinghuense TaxID=2763107 RepID=A0A7G8BFN8_9BACT|nr:carbohydrate-binding protein [Alloacidobacterium dinghuense]QNI31358.1 carbohydrate-binding protein [Alloacidobacterium dinghuense]